MKLDEITVEKDEYYTPPYAIQPLLKYVPKTGIVWCPFDTEDSFFVKMLRAHGLEVIATHISTGTDFFLSVPPKDFDYIISNPPFSLKTEVFERLFELNHRFAMLVGVVGLFESKKRFEMFKNNDWDIMYLDKRVAFFEDYKHPVLSLNPPFSSVYITKGFLPSRIVFETVEKTPQLEMTEQFIFAPN